MDRYVWGIVMGVCQGWGWGVLVKMRFFSPNIDLIFFQKHIHTYSMYMLLEKSKEDLRQHI